MSFLAAKSPGWFAIFYKIQGAGVEIKGLGFLLKLFQHVDMRMLMQRSSGLLYLRQIGK